jgi:hypothetical protein
MSELRASIPAQSWSWDHTYILAGFASAFMCKAFLGRTDRLHDRQCRSTEVGLFLLVIFGQFIGAPGCDPLAPGALKLS